MDYKKLYTGQFTLEDKKKSKDELEWSHFDFPKTIKDYNPIEYIDVSHTEPFPVAITAGAKVVVCESETSPPDHTLSRFQKKAYGAKFRDDGRLLAVGSEQNVVKLFDYKKKSLLRTFTGHTGPVHRVDFISGRPELASFSDDKSIIIWDVATESIKEQFWGHKDAVRAGVTNPMSENIIISGSYDHTLKMWDTRIQSSVKSFSQESIVESLLFFPNGTRLASAGISDLRIWDLVAGKPIKIFSNHHKSITSLAYVRKTNTLLSGSLDKHVKIYSMEKMKYLHTLNYPAPILSLGITDTASTLVVGMSCGETGLVSFQHANREKKTSLLAEERSKHNIYKAKTKADRKYSSKGISQFNKCETYLKKFDYTQCLKALCHKESKCQPQNVVAIYHKFLQLDILAKVLPECGSNVMSFSVDFVVKYITVASYTRIMEGVANILIDLYDNASNKKIYKNVVSRLKHRCELHVTKMVNLAECKAIAGMLLSMKIVEQSIVMGDIEITEKELPRIVTKPQGKRKAVFNVPE